MQVLLQTLWFPGISFDRISRQESWRELSLVKWIFQRGSHTRAMDVCRFRNRHC